MLNPFHRLITAAWLGVLLAAIPTMAAQPELAPQPRPRVVLPDGAIARIGQPRLRLPGPVINVACAPRSATFLTTGNPQRGPVKTDQLVVLWDLATGKAIRQYRGHQSGVQAVAFNRDGSRFVTGSLDRTVGLWDTESGQQLLEFTGHTDAILAVAFAPDGRQVASEGRDAVIRIWNVETGREVKRLPGHKSQGTSNLRYSPDGTKLASVGGDFKVRLWNPHTGAELAQLTGPIRDVESLDFSPDGERLAGVCESGKLWIWDVASGKLLHQPRAHPEQAVCVRWSPDGRTLATGGSDGPIKFWNARTGTHSHTALGHPRGVSELSFSHDSRVLVSVGHEGTARIWNVSTGEELPQSGGGVNAMSLAPDGTRLATQGTDANVRFWNPRTGAVLGEPLALDDPASRLCFAKDSRTLAISNTVSGLQVWDVAAGTLRRDLGQHTGIITSRQVSSSRGRLVATTAGQVLEFWDSTGQALPPGIPAVRTNAARHLPAQALLILPGDTHLVLTGTDFRTRIWDLNSGVETSLKAAIPREPNPVVFALASSADGRTIAEAAYTINGFEIWVWESASGSPRREAIRTPGVVRALAIAPNRRLLAAGGDGGFLVIWDLWNRVVLAGRQAHAGTVTDLAFTPDSSRLISAGGELNLPTPKAPDGIIVGDGTALIWDVAQLTGPIAAIPHPAEDQFDALWADLCSRDATRADSAIWQFTTVPMRSTPWLIERLPRVQSDPVQVAKLLAELDDDDFKVRERATQELIRLGPAVANAVRRERDTTTSREVRRRADEVLAKLGTGSTLTDDELQVLRGVEVLQRIATPSAREALATWAKASENSPLGREARVALLRMPE